MKNLVEKENQRIEKQDRDKNCYISETNIRETIHNVYFFVPILILFGCALIGGKKGYFYSLAQKLLFAN